MSVGDVYGFLAWLVGVAGGSTVLVLIGKAAIPYLLSRDLEKFKADLSREAALEIERVRHDLSLVSVEHETSFKWLHAKRSEAIDEVYQRFVAAAAAIDDASNTAALIADLAIGEHIARIPIDEARVALVAFSEALRGARYAIDEEVDGIFSRALAQLDGLLFHVFVLDSARRADPDFQEAESDSLREIRERRSNLPAVESAVVASLRKALAGGDRSE